MVYFSEPFCHIVKLECSLRRPPPTSKSKQSWDWLPSGMRRTLFWWGHISMLYLHIFMCFLCVYNIFVHVVLSSQVELDSKYKNQTCGLCGDFNGVQLRNEFYSHGTFRPPLSRLVCMIPATELTSASDDRCATFPHGFCQLLENGWPH